MPILRTGKQAGQKDKQLMSMIPLCAQSRQIDLEVAKATTTLAGFSVVPRFMRLEVNHTVHH